jgi:hypothetical protein
METTQGNFLCSYLYLKLAKTPGFSFYLLCFFFYVRVEQVLQGEGGDGAGRRGYVKVARKEERG